MDQIIKFLTIAITSILLVSSGFAFAQNSRPDDLRTQARNNAEETKTTIQQLREQAKANAKEAKDKASQRIEGMKDVAKKNAAKRISGQFDHINEVWTDHFTNVLNKLDYVLQKIKSRKDKAEKRGSDVSQVNSAIQDAESKISAAMSAVEIQAQKIYTIDLPENGSAADEAKLMQDLREQFKNLRNQLFSDLMLLRDGPMKYARSSAKDAFEALSNVPRVDEE